MNKRVSTCTPTYGFVISGFDASAGTRVAEEIRFVEVPIGRVDKDGRTMAAVGVSVDVYWFLLSLHHSMRPKKKDHAPERTDK